MRLPRAPSARIFAVAFVVGGVGFGVEARDGGDAGVAGDAAVPEWGRAGAEAEGAAQEGGEGRGDGRGGNGRGCDDGRGGSMPRRPITAGAPPSKDSVTARRR